MISANTLLFTALVTFGGSAGGTGVLVYLRCQLGGRKRASEAMNHPPRCSNRFCSPVTAGPSLRSERLIKCNKRGQSNRKDSAHEGCRPYVTAPQPLVRSLWWLVTISFKKTRMTGVSSVKTLLFWGNSVPHLRPLSVCYFCAIAVLCQKQRTKLPCQPLAG